MTQNLCRIFSLFLAIILLFSSVGMALNYHTCKESGKTEVSLSSSDFCCNENEVNNSGKGDKKAEPNQEENCCETNKKHVKLDQEAEKSSISILSFNFVFYIIYKFRFADLFGYNSDKDYEPSPSTSSYSNYGRYLLSLFQVFRI
jgi:hypothetical protein